MKWKNRLTNYNFWISIVSAILLIFQAFNLELDIAYINEIATAVLGLLVVIGIISDPTKSYTPSKENKEENKEEVETNQISAEASEGTVKETENSANTNNNKTENVDFFNQSHFQAIIDKISEELNNKLNSASVAEHTSIDSEAEEIVEENSTFHNIVN